MSRASTNDDLIVIGLMSGTSVDAVDACAVRLGMPDDQLACEILATHTEPVPQSLRTRLLKAMSDKTLHLEEFCALDVAVAELFAETANALIAESGLAREAIACIGSHGQTLYHWPPGETHATGTSLQIGQPAIIAERTGLPVVADFRPRDMAAGGQGAPLVCFADMLLFQDAKIARCIQNIGGIANVTVVPAAQNPNNPVIAFDTGPGNMLVDAAMQRFFEQPYDEAGSIAQTGTVNEELLGWLMAHPYLAQDPPKTTGREAFGEPFLNEILGEAPLLPPTDLVATLTEFTARSIVDAYERFIIPNYAVQEAVIGGGGVRNETLRARLAELLAPHEIALRTHADFGIPDQYKEALAFAILAWATRTDRPNNLPSCTGAAHPVILGVTTR